jgi:repressor LexA
MLTKKQKKFLETIRGLVEKKGYFPTVREIGKSLKFSSPATVHSYLNRLFQKGVLKKEGNSWELVPDIFSVPLMGIVPAGSPLEVFENLGEEISLPEWMAEKGGDTLAFRVQGESMRDAYIRDGDIVIVRKTARAENGEMVVALLSDSSITLKRLKNEKGRYWLVPENPDYQPIFESFQLVGKVVGVLRRYR